MDINFEYLQIKVNQLEILQAKVMKFKKPIINGINVLDKEKICKLEGITEENLNHVAES